MYAVARWWWYVYPFDYIFFYFLFFFFFFLSRLWLLVDYDCFKYMRQKWLLLTWAEVHGESCERIHKAKEHQECIIFFNDLGSLFRQCCRTWLS